MRGFAGWALVAVLLASVAWAKPKPMPATAAKPSELARLDRNMALGAGLADKQPSEAQLAEIQKLADEGLRSARAAVQKDPKSADAQYLLGSWLLYGYHVVKVDRITYDAQGLEQQDTVMRLVQGDWESASGGLEALQKACGLAPQNGRYLVDYGAALYDYERPLLAVAVLKKVWMSDLQVSIADKRRAAELMADIDADDGDIASARGWLYRALSESQDNVSIVQRLRKLDVQEFEALTAPIFSPEEEAPAEEEEPATQEQQAPASPDDVESPPAPDQGQSEAGSDTSAGEEQPEADQSQEAPPSQVGESPETPAEPEAGQSQEAPAEPEAAESESAPAE